MWLIVEDVASFRGLSNLNLDPKGRLTMPAKYRDEIMNCCDGKMIMTVDFDLCLLLYPIETWLPIEEKIAGLPGLDKNSKSVQRLLIGHATDVSLDKSGRMLIPPPLRDIAKLDKQIVLLGQGKKFEIWNAEGWKEKVPDIIESINRDELIGDLGSLAF